MARQNVYNEGVLEGWFDTEKAKCFNELTEWNGNNHISVPTGSQWDHQTLYLTSGGRWVLEHSSQWQGSKDTWEFISSEQAKDWMLLNEKENALKKYFGEIDEEQGPGPGRPATPGHGHVQFRLDAEMFPKLEEAAAAAGEKPSEFARKLLIAALK